MQRLPRRLLPSLERWVARDASTLHTPEGGTSSSGLSSPCGSASGASSQRKTQWTTAGAEGWRSMASAAAGAPLRPLPGATAAAAAPGAASGAAPLSTAAAAAVTAQQQQPSLGHGLGLGLDLEHARRLQEQLIAGTASVPAAAQAAQQQQQTQRQRRLDVGAIPMLQMPGRRQQHGGERQEEQEQQQRPPVAAAPAPALDWREVVERARQQQQQQLVSGGQMLTDTFGRRHTYLRISLTERCNLRCTYCMPAEGVALTPKPELLTADEVERLASLFVAAGVDKIRLTGGEPTVRPDLPDICRRLSALPGLRTLAMTSNGIALKRQLPELKAAGLNALNISLDTLRPDRFEQLTRRGGHGRVLAAIESALQLGYDPVKVNVVVMRGVNDDEVADFAALTKDAPVNVRFIEYMPFDGNAWGDGGRMVPYRELVAAVQERFPAGLVRMDDPSGEVAKNFRIPGHVGTVSFVTSMTHAFCGDCNRLRLLADGSLKVCLFGATEVSLRDAIRAGASDDDLRLVVSAAVDRKRAAHAGMFELAAAANRPMITIGG